MSARKAPCFSRTMAEAHAVLCQREAAHWASVARYWAPSPGAVERAAAAQTVAARWAALSRQSAVSASRIARMREHAGNPYGADVVPIEYAAGRTPVESILHPGFGHVVHPCHARITLADAAALAALGIDYVVCEMLPH